MVRNPELAIRAAREQCKHGPRLDKLLGVDDPVGNCLKAVRVCYGVNAFDFTPKDKKVPLAVQAFEHAEHTHPTQDTHKIPRGVPIFWRSKREGRAGHVAISVGDGDCWSTDIRRDGFFDLVPISVIAPEFGAVLLGWTEDLNGVRVWQPPKQLTLVEQARRLLVRARNNAGPVRKRQIVAMLKAGPER